MKFHACGICKFSACNSLASFFGFVFENAAVRQLQMPLLALYTLHVLCTDRTLNLKSSLRLWCRSVSPRTGEKCGIYASFKLHEYVARGWVKFHFATTTILKTLIVQALRNFFYSSGHCGLGSWAVFRLQTWWMRWRVTPLNNFNTSRIMKSEWVIVRANAEEQTIICTNGQNKKFENKINNFKKSMLIMWALKMPWR